MIIDEWWPKGLSALNNGIVPVIIRLPFGFGFTVDHDGTRHWAPDAAAQALALPVLRREQRNPNARLAAHLPYQNLLLRSSRSEPTIMQLTEVGSNVWRALLLSRCECGDPIVLHCDFVFHDHRLSTMNMHWHYAWMCYRQLGGAVTFEAYQEAYGSCATDVFVLGSMLCSIWAFYLLITAKNVELKTITPSPQLQVARQRRGKLPLFTYHELVVRIPQRAHSTPGTQSGQTLPLHWVRGHFKTYDHAGPLFGRLTGRYWWQPHIAGTEKRWVEKDYLIDRGDEHERTHRDTRKADSFLSADDSGSARW